MAMNDIENVDEYNKMILLLSLGLNFSLLGLVVSFFLVIIH